MPGGRKYNAANASHNLSVENKIHSINHSIEHNILTTNERPSSVVESLRYSKQGRKAHRVNVDNKESMSTSIDVPSIELHNQNGTFKNSGQIQTNSLVYQKAAELIAQNFHKNMAKLPVPKTTSNSQKILRSTSRSGKSKKTKLKSQFKKNTSNLDKSIPIKKEQMHRKSKSGAKKFNYAEQFLIDKGVSIPNRLDDRESPIGLPQKYMLGHIGQNWIDNINNQIELNGKSLLDSISKAKQK